MQTVYNSPKSLGPASAFFMFLFFPSFDMITIAMLRIPNYKEGICGLKPAQVLCFCCFDNLCWAELHMHFPHAGKTSSGRQSNIFG